MVNYLPSDLVVVKEVGRTLPHKASEVPDDGEDGIALLNQDHTARLIVHLRIVRLVVHFHIVHLVAQSHIVQFVVH
jgi:hypothetical protein